MCQTHLRILLLSRACNVKLLFRLVKSPNVLQRTQFNAAYQKVSAPKGFAASLPQ